MERTVFWFRKSLRVHDSPALLAALERCGSLLPVFCLDPWFADSKRISTNRYNFLLESLHDVDASLRARGSRLVILRGSPADVLPAALTAFRATRLVFEEDIEPYARERDKHLTEVARAAGVATRSVSGHTLYDPAALQAAAGGSVLPATYEAFLRLTRSLPPPPRPFAAPTVLPPLGGDGDSAFPDESAHRVPTLAACGFDIAAVTTRFRGEGGETRARATLATSASRTRWIETFAKPETNPAALEPATTALSPHLKYGTLGARAAYWAFEDVSEAARAAGRSPTAPPVSLVGQLLWREFFYAQGATISNFDRMEGNRVCRQIDWSYDPNLIRAWEEGRTGYPWIDACMAQLRTDGWLHHLARHSVACFLTRGDLYQSWEHGARVFDKHLVDSDWALNNGNWLWLSASAYFAQFFRVYSPVVFPKKFDADGAYIRKWLPQFARFPAKFIYEPWKAPRDVQIRAGVVVGENYPNRIVDHDVASKANIAKLGRAFEAARDGRGATMTAAADPGARGVGQTQVGSSKAAALVWAAQHGVELGDLPKGRAGAGAGVSAGVGAGAGAGVGDVQGDFDGFAFGQDFVVCADEEGEGARGGKETGKRARAPAREEKGGKKQSTLKFK